MPTRADILAASKSRRISRDEMRGVVAMVVPVVITLCSRLMMDIADFKMIGYLPNGTAAQAAILPAQVTLWTFIVLGFGTVLIVSTFVSQALGRGRLRETSAYAWHGIYIGMAYGVLGLGLYPFLSTIFSWMKHGPEVHALEMAYANVSLLNIGVTIATESLACFFNGIHRPKVSMWSAVECNLINVVASAILVFGLLGAPQCGIAGAAWGTLIGTIYRIARLLISFTSAKMDMEFGSRSSYRWDWSKARAIVRVGLPSGLQAFSDVFVWTLFTSILIGRFFGPDALVASNVAFQYMRISFMPAFGIGAALSALVGKAVGQQDTALALRYARICVLALLGYLAPLSIVYYVFRADLIGWFNDAPAIVSIGSSIMICAVMFQLFDGLMIAYHGALKGAGDTFWTSVIIAVSHWSIVVGGGTLVAKLKPEWGCVGPWWAATALLVFLGVAMRWRWKSLAWLTIDIFSHERSAEQSQSINEADALSAADESEDELMAPVQS